MADRDELKADVIAAMHAVVMGALDTGVLIDIERTAQNIADKYVPSQPVAGKPAILYENVGEVCGKYKGAYEIGNVFFTKSKEPLPNGTKLYVLANAPLQVDVEVTP